MLSDCLPIRGRDWYFPVENGSRIGNKDVVSIKHYIPFFSVPFSLFYFIHHHLSLLWPLPPPSIPHYHHTVGHAHEISLFDFTF